MRRANGTGGIVRMSGQRRRPYAVRVSVPDSTRPGVYNKKYIGYYATIKEAQAALDEFTASGQPAAVAGITLGEVWDAWSERKAGNIALSSMRMYRSNWDHLSSIADCPIAGITLDTLQSVIDREVASGLAPGTVAHIRILIGELWRYALERQYIDRDISQYLHTPTVTPVKKRGVVPEDVIARMWAETSRPWVDTVLILIYTGLRINEYLSITAESYHIEPVPYIIGGSKTEAGKNRIVPIHHRIRPLLESKLERWGKAEQLSIRAVREYISDLLADYGIEGGSPHWCRHTCASRLHQAGADELSIRRILGHSDRSVTDHYTHLDLAHLAAQVELMP